MILIIEAVVGAVAILFMFAPALLILRRGGE